MAAGKKARRRKGGGFEIDERKGAKILELLGHEPLPEFSGGPRGSGGFEDWEMFERRRLEERAAVAEYQGGDEGDGDGPQAA